MMTTAAADNNKSSLVSSFPFSCAVFYPGWMTVSATFDDDDNNHNCLLQ